MVHIAFLRAINVGGRTVKMAALRAGLEPLGLENVETFIASGNVIFESRKSAAVLERAIEAQLQQALGFAVATMLRSVADLRAILEYVAREDLATGGASLYVGFLKGVPAAASAQRLPALSNDLDHLHVRGRELYWRSTPGLGKSTLSGAKIEKLLGVAATLRNINTIERIVARHG